MTGVLEQPVARTGIAVVALSLAWLGATSLLPNGAPIGIVVIGAVLGAATGLAAVAIILVWRANRVVNFAAGALGGAAGLSSIQLFLSWGWPYPLTILAAVLGGLALGWGWFLLVAVVFGGRRQRLGDPVVDVAQPTAADVRHTSGPELEHAAVSERIRE